MAKKKATISRTPRDISLAVAEAERELVLPSNGKNQKVQLSPTQIVTRPELFQPRGFANGFLDTEHVANLVKHIATKGQLEPPIVVKLAKKWVCVDGHHRIAAYIRRNVTQRPQVITCIWFAGTLKQAVDRKHSSE